MLTKLLEVKCNHKCFLFQEKFSGVDIRVTVKGGGHVAQVYAIRQAISKALIAFYQKCKYHISDIQPKPFTTTCVWPVNMLVIITNVVVMSNLLL